MIELNNFYIGGSWVRPGSSLTHHAIDPSTETACARISLGDFADTNAAVAAARSAFGNWSRTDAKTRLELVQSILQAYQRRVDDLATAISLEMGAPIDLARANQVGVGVRQINNFLAAFRTFEFLRPLGDGAPHDRIALEPVGVAGLITPWNWPMNQVTLKVIPAILAGCTMVLKPSEFSSLSARLFAEILEEAGTPPGVFNMVYGEGATVGMQLAAHPDVDMISFTGSTRAGIAITKASADSLKRVCLELGGKGANLIFADADGDAVKRGVQQCFNNSGQSCNAPSRMLVERPLYQQAVDTARDLANSTRVAPANVEGRHIGPVVSRIQFDRIQQLIEAGIAEGARLVAGGPGRPEHLDKGFFVRPTVFSDVDNGMAIARQEIFGPVLSIIPFDTEEDAIQIANDTVYGLSNYVQSSDGVRCNRVARSLRSGVVEINGTPRAPGSPFGGIKASGRAREGGHWGLEEYLDVKAISGWSRHEDHVADGSRHSQA